MMEQVPLALQALLGGQTPQLPPQLSPPHNLPLHCGTQAGPQPPQFLAWHLLTQLTSHALAQQKGS